MANRRMFSHRVVETDKFLDMPQSTQLLYFHLGMHGDDRGFVDKPRGVMRSIGSTEDDMKLLIAKGFVYAFRSGVIVISDWCANNQIRADRVVETAYLSEFQQLAKDETGHYDLIGENTACIPSDNQTTTICQPNDNQVSPQYSIVKDSIEIVADKPPKKTVFVPPTVEDVAAYCKERNNGIDPQQFVDFYEASGWTRGKGTKLKNWKAAVRTWESNRPKAAQPQNGKQSEVAYEGMKKVTDSAGRVKWIPA